MISSKLVYDYLSIGSSKDYAKILEPDEKVFYSGIVKKYNDYNKLQERGLVVTNKRLINLSGKTVKRAISTSKLTGITFTTASDEYVIHVSEEYDYRFVSDKKDLIFLSICESYYASTSKKFVSFWVVADPSLAQYTTTKALRKKNENKMPITIPTQLGAEQWLSIVNKQQTLESYFTFKDATRPKRNTLFSKKKGEEVTLDSFKPLKVLGRGAFGKVMLVEKKDTKEQFALKAINKSDIIEQDQVEHTKAERMVMAHTNHPFLVGLEYAFQTTDTLYFVSQVMKGGELFQHLRMAKMFPEEKAKFYAICVMLGVGHLHSQGILYRDLKPENILMDIDGYVKLTDFGMAKFVKKDEKAKTFCGTPEYISPEVLAEVGHSFPADWWSFGVLVFEMLYGLPPFYSQNQSIMFDKIRTSPVKFPQKPITSPEVQDLIVKLLNKDPNKRLGSKDDVEELKKHPWFSAVNWKEILQRNVPAPFKPNVVGDSWIKNFDEEFTSEAATMPKEDKNAKLDPEFEKTFENFTFHKDAGL